jgi:hypothetical protein
LSGLPASDRCGHTPAPDAQPGETEDQMPTLFKFLFTVGLIVAIFYGTMYALSEYYVPEQKEITKSVRNIQLR